MGSRRHSVSSRLWLKIAKVTSKSGRAYFSSRGCAKKVDASVREFCAVAARAFATAFVLVYRELRGQNCDCPHICE